jgi:hypothetical protein
MHINYDCALINAPTGNISILPITRLVALCLIKFAKTFLGQPCFHFNYNRQYLALIKYGTFNSREKTQKELEFMVINVFHYCYIYFMLS